MKHNQKAKMSQEITIHRALNHKNVVGFHSFFDDIQNVYIVLELCKKRVSYFLLVWLCLLDLCLAVLTFKDLLFVICIYIFFPKKEYFA